MKQMWQIEKERLRPVDVRADFPEAREKFQEEFWKNKSIAPEEYYRRIQYIDSTYGSSKPASGANTDPGRIYLSLGPPNRITRIPSSRILVPLEIWYYDSVPGVLNTELRLIFFQKNSVGFLKLYSPTVDTIRALLLPQASTNGMFGPNDGITEAMIRTNLTLPSAEDEAISAAMNVATVSIDTVPCMATTAGIPDSARRGPSATMYPSSVC